MPSSEKKKLASRRDFLVFWTKIHVELLPGKLTHNFYAHYSQCSTKRSLQKLMDNFSSRGGEKVDSNQLLLPLLPSLSLISHRMQLCCHPQRRKKLASRRDFSFLFTKNHVELSPGKLTHNFLLTTASAVPSVRFKKLMDNFQKSSSLFIEFQPKSSSLLVGKLRRCAEK